MKNGNIKQDYRNRGNVFSFSYFFSSFLFLLNFLLFTLLFSFLFLYFLFYFPQSCPFSSNFTLLMKGICLHLAFCSVARLHDLLISLQIYQNEKVSYGRFIVIFGSLSELHIHKMNYVIQCLGFMEPLTLSVSYPFYN